jgi:hypothetical protein
MLIKTKHSKAAIAATVQRMLFRKQGSWPDRAGLFWLSMVVFWAKLYLISSHASITPFWDQWDAQGMALYSPYLQGELTLEHVLYPQNEHHIVITKLLSLLLLELSGTWDTSLEMILNAGIHVAAMVVFLRYSTLALGRLAVSVFLPYGLIVLVLPLGWENTLWGFQSQFYLMVLMTLVAMGLCLGSSLFSRRWWVGLGVSAASVLTMASGVMVFPVLLGFTAIRLWRGGEDLRRGLAASALYLALFSAAVVWIPDIPQNAVLRAGTPTAFVGALARILAWPMAGGWLSVSLSWLPGLVLAWQLLWRGFPAGDRAMPLLAVLAWVFLQNISLAYGRASSPLSSRYLDVVVLGVLANVLSAIVVWERMEGDRRRVVAAASVLALMCWVLAGVFRESQSEVAYIRSFTVRGIRQTENVRGFMETGDSSYLFGKPFMEIPYPDPVRLQACLRQPSLRGLLPAALGSTARERSHSRQLTFLGGRLYGVMQRVKRMSLHASPLFLLFSVVGFSIFGLRAMRPQRPEPR